MALTQSVKTLTIFLLKPGVDEQEALDEESAAGLQVQTVTLGSKKLGSLYARQAPLAPPSWLKLFADAVDNKFKQKLKTTSVAAAFFTPVGGRLFALVFGQGRHLLRPGAYEERFGLRVTLNSVDPKKLRAVDVATLETNPFHGKRQASRAASLGELGLDLDQDILRAVTGKPIDEDSGTQMAGIDSLSVRVRVDLASLRKLLKRYLEISERKDYQLHFPWVDHVSEVRDAKVNEALFATLEQVLCAQQPGNVWAAIPEVIDWTTFDTFRFGSIKAAGYDDITLERLTNALEGAAPSIELMRQKRVHCMAENKPHPQHTWTFLKCLTAELATPNGVHVLNAGTWYRVSSDFVQQVDADIAALKPSVVTLPEWGDEHEDAYCERIAKKSKGELALMDRVMIQHAGMASPIEFCDLYSKDRRLIHVKRYGQSSILSHLFMQGLVSANSLLADVRFRQVLNEKLPKSHVFSRPGDRPDPQLFEVAFAIGSKEVGPLQLPFFSRVTLKNVARTIMQSYGYRVTVNKIQVNKLTDIGH